MATTLSTGPSVAAVPHPGLAPSPQPAPGGNVHVLASLRRHSKLAIYIALILALVAFPAAWVLGTPKYSATAVIYVSPRFIANLADGNAQKFDSMEQYREYVQQNVKTINRFDIMLDALQRAGGAQSSWIKPGESLERAASRLQGALIIEAVPDTYQITITLDGKRKAGLAELVNSVADTYLERAKAEEFFGSNQRVQSLVEERARLQKEIAEKQARRMTLAQQLGVSSFTDNDLNPYDRLLVTAKEAQSEAQKNAIEAETQLAVFDEQQHAGGKKALHAFALSEANKDPVLTTVITSLNARRAQVQASLSGLSPDHPGRKAAERELSEIEDERHAAVQSEVESLSKTILDQRTAEAYQARQVERQLTAEVDRQAAQASWFTRGYQEGIQLGLEVDEARKTEENVQQRIDYFTLEKSAPGFVRLFSAARVPDQPVKGRRKLLFAVFLALGIAFAVALPVGIDLLDPRLHSPNQVEALLGIPVTSWLMDKEEAGEAFEREQIMRFSHRLVQDRQSNQSRIFAVTSVKSRGGASTVVLRTARTLASLGVSALALEANAYRGDVRYSKPQSRGLAAVFNGDRHFDSEVVSGDAELPDRMPIGEVNEGTRLPGIQNLEEHLQQALEAYDVVLIDAPPILASVDAEIIACLADVVVLVIEAESVTKDELRRAARSLERLKVGAIAALVNRVRRDEPSGAAEAAVQEFRNGSGLPAPRLLTPWLWR